MRNKLDIICIDGIVGVGKTTQVVLFRNLLKLHDIPHKIISLSQVEDTEITKAQLLDISEYLTKEPEGVVICDGSIASDIVDDMAKNMLAQDLWEKHKDNLRIYEGLNNQFNFINILLTPMNLDICQDRSNKKAKMFRKEQQDIENIEHLRVTSHGLRNFDNNMLTYNIKFNNIDLFGGESINQIHDRVLEIVKARFQIIKKALK